MTGDVPFVINRVQLSDEENTMIRRGKDKRTPEEKSLEGDIT
jgi:hypothetical protein